MSPVSSFRSTEVIPASNFPSFPRTYEGLPYGEGPFYRFEKGKGESLSCLGNRIEKNRLLLFFLLLFNRMRMTELLLEASKSVIRFFSS